MESKEPLDNQVEILVDKRDLVDEQINSINESNETLEELEKESNKQSSESLEKSEESLDDITKSSISEHKTQNKKLGKKLWLIITSVFVSIALIAGGIFAVIKSKSNNDNNIEPQSYMVVFKVDDSIYSFSQVNAGEKISKPTTDPVKEGYTFVGWYNDETEWNFETDIVTQNLILTAKFSTGFYNVTFKVNDEIYETKKVECGKKVEIPLYEKAGYTIKWYNGEDEWNFENKVTCDLVLTLNQEPIVYTATFKADGEVVEIRTFTVEDTVIANIPQVPSKSGYTGVWESYTIKAENITINAIYTEEEPSDSYVKIRTKQDLIDYASNVENYTVNARLYSDIDLGGMEWTPIGDKTNKYQAEFDGNEFKVTNFKITTDRENNGLFGYTLNALIIDLGLENFEINYNREYDTFAGGLVGTAEKSTITNCYVTGNITSKTTIVDTSSSSGGLVGYAFNFTTITNSFATGNVYSRTNSGGLIGNAFSNVVVTNCYATGNITTKASGYGYAGGLIGYAGIVTVENSYSTGSVVVNSNVGSYGGGFSGNAQVATIKNCYATGSVSCENSSREINIGGFTGFASGNTTITNSYATGNVTASINYADYNTYAGGFVGYANNNVKLECSYATGNVSSSLSTYSNYTDSYAGGFIGKYEDTKITNCYRYSGQVITSTKKIGANASSNGGICKEGTSADMETIWAYVENTWSDEIWNFYIDKNPTLKNIKAEEIKKVTVTFKIGETTYDTKEIILGQKVSKPIYTKNGYTIKWYNESSEWNFDNAVTADLVLTLYEEVIEYTATFKADGQIVTTRTFTVEDTEIANIPQVPSKAGYTGAWESYTIKAENIVVNAKYTAIEYTATFKADGEVVEIRTFTVEDTEIANIPQVPNKAGYTGAWESYTIKAENIVVNSKYTAIEYTATFKADGVVVETRTFTVEDTEIADVPQVPSKAGYTGVWENYTIKAENITINAIYTEDEIDDGYVKIRTKQDLIDYASNTNNYTVNARLYEDIDLGGMEWTPIGDSLSNAYKAIFDGNGYKITNFKITISRDYNGFFGYVKNATIKDLGLESFEINDYGYVGGLVGHISYSSIENCYANGNIISNSESSDGNIGVLVGYASNTAITNSYAIGYVTANLEYSICSGGLIGWASDLSIENCYAYVAVNATSNKSDVYAGSLIGRAFEVFIVNCFSGGMVSAISNAGYTPAAAGGLVGALYDSEVNNTYATGNTTASSKTGSSYAGGLIGYVDNSTIEDSYASGEVISGDDAGGLVGYVYDSTTINNCYATGSVTASSDDSASAGGLVGRIVDNSTIKDSYASGEVISKYNAGGLVGGASDSTITNCYATGLITASSDNYSSAGGLIGYSTNSTIEDSYASGEVISKYNAGGLVGGIDDNSTIKDSYASGEVISKYNAGGLVGGASDSTITNCYATGLITASLDNYSNAGGLIGYSTNSTIEDSYASGEVISEENAGGLVGSIVDNSTIEDSYASGEVISKEKAGGLVGVASDSTITNCYATGKVTISSLEFTNIGGLVGYISSSTITNCYALGNVIVEESYFDAFVGGLIGSINNSNITNCYRYSGQVIEANGGIVCEEGTSADMATIWAFVKSTWDSDIWELYSDKNPTLKFENNNDN